MTLSFLLFTLEFIGHLLHVAHSSVEAVDTVDEERNIAVCQSLVVGHEGGIAQFDHGVNVSVEVSSLVLFKHLFGVDAVGVSIIIFHLISILLIPELLICNLINIPPRQ